MNAPLRVTIHLFRQPDLNSGMKLFDPQYASFYTKPFTFLRGLCSENGIELSASADANPASTNIMLMVDLPDRMCQLLDWFQKYAHTKKILIIHESPIRYPEYLMREIHNKFDAVLTYDHNNTGPNIIHYGMPVVDESEPVKEGMPFEKRKLAVMIATNYSLGTFGWRRWALASALRGWPIPWDALLNTRSNNDGYSVRRAIANAAEQLQWHHDELSIFGKGWSGEARNRLERVFKPKNYSISRGLLPGDESFPDIIGNRRFFFAVENYLGDHGYISEKIFLGLKYGSVPVYFGDNKITSWLSRDAFINGGDYKSHVKLLQFLKLMDKRNWMKMREAGANGYAGAGQAKYGFLQFSRAVIQAVKFVTEPAGA